jgi:beta-N-acetylhexosaminidase
VAPDADVDVPQGALSSELFGTDPRTVAALSTAAVQGYHAGGLIAAVGHFPGQGAASADPDALPATVGGSLAALRTRDLIPFGALASSAPIIVMSNASYAAFDGVTPAGLLPQAVQLLRELGFNGVVMSDDLDATLQATGQDAGAVALMALQAGDDLLLISGTPHERLHAVATIRRAAGRSPAVAALVRQALLRVLTLKLHDRLLASR